MQRGSFHTHWHHAQPAVLSALLAVLLYAVTLGGGYVYDDKTIVRDDPRMHDPVSWRQLWTQAYFPAGVDHLYRPVVSSSYAIEWWLHGDRPWMFHAVNVMLHALAAAGVAEFTRRVLRANAPALIAGLLFAAHPIHVEAVANIVGRAELACTACIFAALILLCHRPLTTARVLAIVAIAMVGLLCKEQGIVQPLIWVFLGLTVPGVETRNQQPEIRFKSQTPVTKTLILLTTWTWAIYLLLREHYLKFEWDPADMDASFNPLIQSIGWDRVLMPVVLLGHYTALLLWPAHLSLDYGADAIGHVARASDAYLWIGLLAIATWIVGVLTSVRRRTPAAAFVLFCLLSLAVTYGVVGNIVTLIGTNFGERLMYLPSAFVLMIVAVVLRKLPRHACAFVTVALLICASVRTVTAARNWNHPLDLYRASLSAQPKSVQAHLLLAEEYRHRGDFTDARSTLAEACAQYPGYWRVWQYRSEEALAERNLNDAEMYLARALRLNHHPMLMDLADRIARARASSPR
jgi:hypothetical protein